jgi:hypothetical protein
MKVCNASLNDMKEDMEITETRLEIQIGDLRDANSALSQDLVNTEWSNVERTRENIDELNVLSDAYEVLVIADRKKNEQYMALDARYTSLLGDFDALKGETRVIASEITRAVARNTETIAKLRVVVRAAGEQMGIDVEGL